MTSFVSTNWVAEQLEKQNNKLKIVDTRFTLSNPNQGRQQYATAHLPNAVYLDLEQDLSGPVKTHGGRHPLPDRTKFTQKLGSLGFEENSHVVIYDQDGMVASRLWWLLQWVGLTSVYVLDGGWKRWLKEKRPTEHGKPYIVETEFQAKENPSFQPVNGKTILEKIHSANTFIIDSREQSRYLGLFEPIDRKSGHIPTALNYDWKALFHEEGKWKSIKELNEHFKTLKKDAEIIVYCGSGVSACPNVLALKEIGFENVALYPGSWSDWISYEDNPISVKE